MDYILIIFGLMFCLSEIFCSCTYPKHSSSDTFKKIEDRLRPLVGKRYSAFDEKAEYTYNVGICTDAFIDMEKINHAGVVQTNIKDKKQPKIIVGKYTDTQVMMGTKWLVLEYNGGKKYGSHCNKEDRRATIMIVCDPSQSQGALRVIEENTNKSSNCYYLFELSHSAICLTPSAGLSIGSIVVIIFVTIAILYFFVGFLYQRFAVGAKGYEQIPNYSFWKDFGNLQADGCELICRSGRIMEPKTYKGLGDDQLQNDDDDDRDDHLLPM